MHVESAEKKYSMLFWQHTATPQVVVEHVDMPSVIAGGIFMLIGETDVH